jgi:hypothetical protein
MNLELKSLKPEAVSLLEADGWTIEKLAVATIKELVAYKGIGRVGGGNAIAEATEILNQQGLEDAETLAIERYYQKAPLAKILTDWEEAGLSIEAVALSSARALVVLKNIEKSLALKLISAAQNIVNKRALYQSRVATPGAEARQINPAFDEKWLSGEVEPPPMSLRVQRNFEKAQREYRAANG